MTITKPSPLIVQLVKDTKIEIQTRKIVVTLHVHDPRTWDRVAVLVDELQFIGWVQAIGARNRNDVNVQNPATLKGTLSSRSEQGVVKINWRLSQLPKKQLIRPVKSNTGAHPM